MSHKHSYKYSQLLAQIFICLLALHLAQCQGCSKETDKTKPIQQLPKSDDPLPVNQLDEKIVTGIKNDFLKTLIKDLQADKPVNLAKQDPTPGGNRDTPIMLAIREPQNQVNILAYLLSSYKGPKEELKQKLNLVNMKGETALLLATGDKHYNPAVIKLLVKNGADPYATNTADLGPVLLAILSNNLEALQSLLNDEVGYSGQCMPKTGFTPLHLAASENNKAIIKYLLSKGADKSKIDNSGSQPISYATDPEVKALLQP